MHVFVLRGHIFSPLIYKIDLHTHTHTHTHYFRCVCIHMRTLVSSNCACCVLSQGGKTPLDLANDRGHTEVAARLLKAAGGGAKS